MDFWTAVTSTIRHIHPLITDFPAAFLPLSVVLNLLSRKWPNLQQSAWITMLIGTGGAILAFITGDATAENLPSTYRQLVPPHQLMAIVTTLIFTGLSIWKWRSQRKKIEIMNKPLFIILSIVGMICLIITGMFGGSMVFDHGVGVNVIQ